MPDPSFALRAAPSGPVLVGTAGNVLTFDAGGRTVSGKPLPSGGLTSFNGRSAPAVVPTAGDYDATEITNTATTISGPSVAAALDNLNVVFRATLYVDPAFTGISTGSQASPHKTVAAAFVAAAALALAGGVIEIPANTTLVENVVFPTTGDWEIRSAAKFGYVSAIIQGTVTLNSAQASQYALTNVQVTGNVTGNATGAPASRLRLSNAILNAQLTLTGTAAAVWRVLLDGSMPGPVGMSGAIAGAVAVTGAVFGSGYSLFLGFASSVASQFLNMSFNNAAFAGNAAGALVHQFFSCTFTVAMAFVANTGSMQLKLDGASAASLLAVGFTAGAGVTTTASVASGSDRRTVAANLGATTIAQRSAPSLMVVEAALTIKVPGTTGPAVLNVIYTDANGTIQTKPVATIADISAAASTEAHGVVPFEQNGATVIQYSITGIVTPGALSLAVSVSVRQAS